MYGQPATWYIRGEGNQPAGPFTAEQLVDSLRSGRLNANTICWSEGMAQWLPMAQVEPFASVLRAPGTPGRLKGERVQLPPMPEQTYAADGPGRAPRESSGVANGFAIGGMALGIIALILSIVPFVGTLAIYPGAIALGLSLIAVLIGLLTRSKIGLPISAMVVSALPVAIAVFWLHSMFAVGEAIKDAVAVRGASINPSGNYQIPVEAKGGGPFGRTPLPLTVLDKEAAKLAIETWKPTRLGESYYIWVLDDGAFASHQFVGYERGRVETMYEFREAVVVVSRGGVDDADRLNGLEWQGTVQIDAKASRSRRFKDSLEPPDKDWSRWEAGIPLFFFKNPLRLEKSNGKWVVKEGPEKRFSSRQTTAAALKFDDGAEAKESSSQASQREQRTSAVDERGPQRNFESSVAPATIRPPAATRSGPESPVDITVAAPRLETPEQSPLSNTLREKLLRQKITIATSSAVHAAVANKEVKIIEVADDCTTDQFDAEETKLLRDWVAEGGILWANNNVLSLLGIQHGTFSSYSSVECDPAGGMQAVLENCKTVWLMRCDDGRAHTLRCRGVIPLLTFRDTHGFGSGGLKHGSAVWSLAPYAKGWVSDPKPVDFTRGDGALFWSQFCQFCLQEIPWPPPLSEKPPGSGPMTGTWRASNGDEYSIDDDGDEATIEMLASDTLKKFSGVLKYNKSVNAKFLEGTGTVIGPDAPKQYVVHVTVTYDDSGHLSFRIPDAPKLDSQRNYVGRGELKDKWQRIPEALGRSR